MKRFNIKIFLIHVFLMGLSYNIFCTIPSTSNTSEEINECEGKIKLKLVKKWGGDDTDDENLFFKMPHDIKINGNLVYIIDAGYNCINVFDRNQNFKMSIGQKGKGPGDLYYPFAIAFDSKNNLIVDDSDNYRIQIFDIFGKHKRIFKINHFISNIAVTKDDKIAVRHKNQYGKPYHLISLYDNKGNFLKNIGRKPGMLNKIDYKEGISFVFDDKNNIFFSFYVTPFIYRYSMNEKPGLIINFTTAYTNSMDISIHQKGFIFLLIATRKQRKDEVVFLTDPGETFIPEEAKNNDWTKTDMYRLLVFNEAGKIAAAQKLSVYCNFMYVHKNSLFLIDSYRGKIIYEYQIEFNSLLSK